MSSRPPDIDAANDEMISFGGEWPNFVPDGSVNIRSGRVDHYICQYRWTFLITGLPVWMKTSFRFSRRGPDHVTEELAAVLSKKASYEFKALFLIVHENLRSRNAATGGEEMLRLRAYEKLQELVRVGIVKKTGKEYTGVTAALAAFMATAAELNAKLVLRAHDRAAIVSNVSSPAASMTWAKAVKVAKAKLSKATA